MRTETLNSWRIGRPFGVDASLVSASEGSQETMETVEDCWKPRRQNNARIPGPAGTSAAVSPSAKNARFILMADIQHGQRHVGVGQKRTLERQVVSQ
jgi:hypothetical protein